MVTLRFPLLSWMKAGKTFSIFPWSGDWGKRTSCSRLVVATGGAEVDGGVEADAGVEIGAALDAVPF